MRCFDLFFCNHLHYINKLQFEFIFIYIFSSLFIQRRNILIYTQVYIHLRNYIRMQSFLSS